MKKFLGLVSVLFFVACGDENPANKLVDDDSFLSSDSVQSSSIEKITSSSSKTQKSSSSDKSQSSSSKDELSSSSVEKRALSSSNISSSNSETSSSSKRESSSSALLAYSSSMTESSSSEKSSSSVFVKVCGPEPASVSIEEVFENQSKAVYPDSCEYDVNINIDSPMTMNLSMTVYNGGPGETAVESYSSLASTRTIRNNGRVKVVDIKNGKILNSSEATTNFLDFQPFIGTAADYSSIVFEDGLWKLTPKDDSGKTLFYSACEERLTKIFYVSGDSVNTMTYSYYNETDDFPGVVKRLNYERSVYMRDSSSRALMKKDTIKVIMDWKVESIMKRHVLPPKMFDVD